MKADIVPLSSIEPDARNANRHSERGEYMVRRSMERFGYAEAGTLDRHNRLIAGNLRTEIAADVLDTDEAIVIDVDGKRPVYIRRRDIDLDTPEGRELAIALNRAAQVSIDFDPAVIAFDLEAGMDLGDWFKPYELDMLMGNIPVGIDPNEEWKGMPEFENEAVDVYKTIKVHFKTEEDYRHFALLIGQPLTDKTISIYHPRQLNENLKAYRVIDES